MSSYVLINIDTTKPELEIYSPQYTTRYINNEIVLKSDETLDSHEVYVIDNDGLRHNYTFQQTSEDEYTGYVKFYDMPNGIVTLYANVTDEVGNVSNLISSSIEIKDSLEVFKVDVKDKPFIYISKSDISTNVVIDDRETLIEEHDVERSLEVSDRTSKVEIKENDNNNENEVLGNNG